MIGIYNDLGFYNPNGGSVYTVEGKQVHINGVENTSISNASVDMTPAQSLNGYDAPWVGGAGKNKYPTTAGEDAWVNNASATHSNNNGELVIVCTSNANSGAYGNGQQRALINQQSVAKTVSFDLKVATATTITVQGNAVEATTSYTRKSITIPASTSASLSVYGRGTANTIYIKNLMISEDGSTDYAPYTNICPISGTSSLNLYRRSSTSGLANTTYSQSLGRTVYYGNFNYTTGKLTLTHALLTLTSSLSWEEMSATSLGHTYIRFRVTVSGAKSSMSSDELMSTQLNYTSSTSYLSKYGQYTFDGQYLYFYNYESGIYNHFASLSDFTTWLDAQNSAGTPVQILYPLATSTEYTLTASTISLLSGDNYFDTNSTAANRFNVSITYRDSMLYIKRPSDFAIEREDIYAGEYTTCTGSVKADRVGWKYSDITINCDELTEVELSFFSSMSGASTFYFEDSDGSHAEQVIRTGFSNTPTRLTLPDGDAIWKNVGIGLRFINAHND